MTTKSMKHSYTLTISRRFAIFGLWTLFSIFTATPLALAQQEDEDVPPPVRTDKKKKQAASPVVKAIKKMKKISGRLNPKADYYIYLTSSAGCGACHKEMPQIVSHHKEMKKDGRADIILIYAGPAASPEHAKKFAKDYDAKFCTVMENDKNCKFVPGYVKPGGIPHCIVVNRYGKVLATGSPNLIFNWQAETIDKGIPEAPVNEQR